MFFPMAEISVHVNLHKSINLSIFCVKISYRDLKIYLLSDGIIELKVLQLIIHNLTVNKIKNKEINQVGERKSLHG